MDDSFPIVKIYSCGFFLVEEVYTYMLTQGNVVGKYIKSKMSFKGSFSDFIRIIKR